MREAVIILSVFLVSILLICLAYLSHLRKHSAERINNVEVKTGKQYFMGLYVDEVVEVVSDWCLFKWCGVCFLMYNHDSINFTRGGLTKIEEEVYLKMKQDVVSWKDIGLGVK